MVSLDFFIYRRYYNFFLSVLLILICGIFFIATIQLINISVLTTKHETKRTLSAPSVWKDIVIKSSNIIKHPTNNSCHYFNCFDIYRCGRSGNQKLSVYTYPLVRYLDEDGVEIKPLSKEFLEIIETVLNSEYYVEEPENACVFIPTIDTLNENNLRTDKISEMLSSLLYWSGGDNHLLFNLLPGTPPNFHATLGVQRGKALVAGGGFSSLTYRKSYDISLPVFNPLYQHTETCTTPRCRIEPGYRTLVMDNYAVCEGYPVLLSMVACEGYTMIDFTTAKDNDRKWHIVSAQVNIHRDYRDDLEAQVSALSKRLLVLGPCNPVGNLTQRCRNEEYYEYPFILHDARFCVVIRGGRLGQTALHDAMKSGCVPIIVADGYVLPFSEIIDWKRAAILLYEEELPDLVSIIQKHVSLKRLAEMQQQVVWLYEKYFSSMKKITLTALKILNDRVFPAHARNMEEWNQRPIPNAVNNPLFLPVTAPAEEGFTAVVLTYDRINSLFQVIENISKVPSLSKILVVWNNQKKKAPSASHWPKIDVPLKVIETKENKLSNRFYPYKEIETECILAIDDDINMMTADELEFGYHVWREFPDRIVGFPSRNVVWNNITQSWKYDSEWTNEVSMVLTGVAFYHKYWSYSYTTQMPGDIKNWVDTHMNCEDIAMNFLVANKTGKAPIKVAPRKKFKCGDCTSGDLSANEAHLIERSQCVNYFSKVFGTMPLKTVEYRADPLLFKDDIPKKLKMFNDIGSL